MPSPRFVVGYAQNLEEKAHSRAIIQAHNSRIRWRRRSGAVKSNIGSSVVHTELSKVNRASSRASQTPVPLSNRDPSISDGLNLAVLPPWPPTVDVSQQTFSRSLKFTTLPPPLPLDQVGLVPDDEVWIMLRRVQDAFNQAFPTNSRDENPFAEAWMECVISSAGALHAQLFSQVVRDEFLDTVESLKRKQLALKYYSKAIESINRNMRDSETACSDDNILAVFFLSHHQTLEDAEPQPPVRPRPNQGPLDSLRLLNLYGGAIKPVETHAAGMAKMIKIRGGMKAIGLLGLGHQISYGEIIFACRHLQPPRLGYIPCLKLDFHTSFSAINRAHHPLKQMGQGFDVLETISPSRAVITFQAALDRLALYSLIVDDYIAGRPLRKSLGIIGELRNFAQHSIMSLVSFRHDKEIEVTIRLCLIAGVIYSFLCVLPLASAPFETLCSEIKSCFSEEDLSEEWKLAPHLIVWILMMGGMASVGMSKRSFYIAVLDRCFRRLKIDSWEELKSYLQEFLWLPVTNDVDGINLWEEIEASEPWDLENSGELFFG